MYNKYKNVMMIITNDTKHKEAIFIRSLLLKNGVNVIHLDASIRGKDNSSADITPNMIARAVGMTMHDVRSLNHEGKSLDLMTKGAINCALDFNKKYGIAGIIGLGGAMGTALATAIMRSFKHGLPKLMISTLASGQTRPYVGSYDIMMVNPICDINGLNSVNKLVYINSVIAIAAQAKAYQPPLRPTRPLILITTLSTTDPCTIYVRRALESYNFEVLVFHTLGSGGLAMETIIRERTREIAVVLDLSLVEITGFLKGASYAAGPDRGKVALQLQVPTIFVPGNLDFFVSGPIEEAKIIFPARRYHAHNMSLTAVRTNKNDLKQVAKHMAQLTSYAKAPVAFYIPLQGFSEHDSVHGHLHDSSLPAVFASYLKAASCDNLDFREFDLHINDQRFAEILVTKVLSYSREWKVKKSLKQ